jgi:hypothetical protein
MESGDQARENRTFLRGGLVAYCDYIAVQFSVPIQVKNFLGLFSGQIDPISCIAATTRGLIGDGTKPALSTSRRSPADCFKKASAIWLWAELWMQTNSTLSAGMGLSFSKKDKGGL